MLVDILILVPLFLLVIAIGFIIGRSGHVKKHDPNDKYQGGFDPQHDHHFDSRVKYHDDEQK